MSERLLALTPAFLVICSLLALAGAAKMSDPAATRSALDGAGVPAATALVRIIGILEGIVAVWAALHPSQLTGALVAAAYAAFGAFVVVQLHIGGANSDCGCFGAARTRPGALHLGLNAVACVIAALVALDPSHGLPWIVTRSPLVSLTLIGGTTGAAYAAYLTYTVVPDAWRAYGWGLEASRAYGSGPKT